MASQSKKAIVIFSGFNQRAVIAFIRTLVKKNLPFFIIALSKNDPIFLSIYKKNVVAIREKTQLDLDDIQNCLATVKQVAHSEHLFLSPSTEALNRFLLKNRSILEQNNCIIPLVDESIYKIISDKKSFGDLCIKYGITVPSNIDFAERNIPFVIKPKYYENTDILSSPILVKNIDDFHKLVFNEQDYYCQEYINGKSYYLLYYFSKNGSVHKLYQENLLQQAQGKSITAARIVENIHNDERFIKMFQDIGFLGLVMVEVREKNGDLCMIEANPRFWGPSQLFVDSGLNLFEAFLRDYGFLGNDENEPNINKNALYYWSGGRRSDEFFHNKNDFSQQQYLAFDIYKREDTMEIYKKELVDKLISYYNQISKHSQYQVLPQILSKFINQESLNVKSRAENERMAYILQNVSLKNKTILDIGANTGFFTFEAINNEAQKVFVYEGNKNHANFIRTAAELLSLEDKIDVQDEYYSFNGCSHYDIVLLLNVLHHVGDDYGASSLSIENAKKQIIAQLNKMSECCKTIVFQLGFNWKGNRNTCLFPNGTKKEMIDFIKNGTVNNWKITNIGIAEETDQCITYKDLSDKNITRNDSLGEFLNRPIFIMQAKEH